MLKQIDDNTYTFSIKKNNYEIFFAKDGNIEIYDFDDPNHTGFVFEDIKKINIFINTVTDILEKKLMEIENE